MPERIRSPRSPRTSQPPPPQDELFKERSLLKAKAKDTGGIGWRLPTPVSPLPTIVL